MNIRLEPKRLDSPDSDKFELSLDTIIFLQQNEIKKYKTVTFVSNQNSTSSKKLVEIYARQELGVNLNTEPIQRQGVYYFQIDIQNVRESALALRPGAQGEDSLASSVVLSPSFINNDNEVDGFLIFVVHRVPFRALPYKTLRSFQLLFCVSNLFVVMIKKQERGINLEDFMFLEDVFRRGKVEHKYKGTEKFRKYLPGIMLCYLDYHKELRIKDMDDYFRGKLDSRKPNQVRKFNLVKDGMKFKVPYLGLHSIMKSPGVSNNSELMVLSQRITEYIREQSNGNFNGSLIMAIFLEVLDSLESVKSFYFKQIYKSAKMSRARKAVENLQTNLNMQLSTKINEDEFPLREEQIEEARIDFLNSLIEQFSDSKFSSISFGNGFEFFKGMVNSFEEFLESSRRVNREQGDVDAKEMVEQMIQQVPKVSEIDERNLSNPKIFDQVQEIFQEVIQHFHRGLTCEFQYRYVFDTYIQFVLDYCKNLFSRSSEAKDILIANLDNKVTQKNEEVEKLKEKLDNQENSYIEAEKMKAKFSTDTIDKDMIIGRLRKKMEMESKIQKTREEALEKKVHEYEESLSTKSKVIEANTRQLSQLKEKLNDLQRENDLLNQKIAGFEKKSEYFKKMRAMRSKSNSSTDVTRANGGDDSLEEVWSTVDDIKKKFDEFTSEIKTGFQGRNQKLTESLLDKDNQVFEVIQESEKQTRNLKSQHKLEIKKLKLEYEADNEELRQSNYDLKTQLSNLKVKILDMENSLIQDKRTNERIEELQNLIESYKRDKEVKEDLIKVEKDVISTFVKQVEDKERKRAELDYKMSRYNQWKKDHKNDKRRLLNMTKQVLLKLVKKKNHDMKKAYQELDDQDRAEFMGMLNEIKVNVNKYIN